MTDLIYTSPAAQQTRNARGFSDSICKRGSMERSIPS